MEWRSSTRDVEMPLAEALADMEMAGVKVDSERLRELSREMDSRLDQPGS